MPDGTSEVGEPSAGHDTPAAPRIATVAGSAAGGASDPIYVRVGRYGPFLQQGELRAGVPDGLPPDELSYRKAIELLSSAAQAEEPLGHDPASGKPIFVRQGRFGPFVQLGTNDDEEKKYASLLKGMEPEQVSLQTALDLLSLPKTLGDDPDSGEQVIASNGRYGPYVKCGSQTRSLPADLSVLDVNLEQALALLAQPKVGRGRQAAVPKEPLKTFEASPVTGQPVKLLDGRYGPYVTDGETNASLPKGANAEALTLEEALQLLADRAAAGGTKKKKAKNRCLLNVSMWKVLKYW
jgi:DNA topoisomerase-1